MSWFFLAGAIVFEVAGTLMLRASKGLRNKKWALPLLIAYIVSFGMLAQAMGHGMAIGVAYGIWTAFGVALTAIVAHILYKDPFTATMGLGIVFIAGGVLLIELGAHPG